ncbi:vomeronasal 1 receptor monDomV1R1219 [Monodelphis domestica]|uniref:Vomeronasal type-1 receptor n=1 Tax=Monodelphis domestica TaxID=13616 RepID=A0A5F8G8C5_MONDO|nr:vomeronasal 1 receptor monDomV1R1219 [Monodelphis domestica]
MLITNMCFGIIILFQAGFGVLINFFLLSFYSFSVLTGQNMRPINLIFIQLFLVNIIMLLTKGAPEILINLGTDNFLNNVSCKLVFYFHRLAQALSICLTCYLCIFQAIIISTKFPRLVQFKARVLDYMIYSCFLCWIFNILLEIPVLFSMTGPRHINNITYEFNFGYCFLERHMNTYWVIITLRNMFCMVFILWASGYMVNMLYTHQKKMKTIHISSLSSRASTEVRITKTILLLVSTFVCFYSLSSMFAIFIHYFYQQRFWLLSTNGILSLCFPTFSPFVLIPQRSRIYTLFWMGKNNHPLSNPSATHYQGNFPKPQI